MKNRWYEIAYRDAYEVALSKQKSIASGEYRRENKEKERRQAIFFQYIQDNILDSNTMKRILLYYGDIPKDIIEKMINRYSGLINFFLLNNNVDDEFEFDMWCRLLQVNGMYGKITDVETDNEILASMRRYRRIEADDEALEKKRENELLLSPLTNQRMSSVDRYRIIGFDTLLIPEIDKSISVCNYKVNFDKWNCIFGETISLLDETTIDRYMKLYDLLIKRTSFDYELINEPDSKNDLRLCLIRRK